MERDEHCFADVSVRASIVCPSACPVGRILLSAVGGVCQSEASGSEQLNGFLVGNVGRVPSCGLVGPVEHGAGIVEQHTPLQCLSKTGGDAPEIRCLVLPTRGEHRHCAVEILADEVHALLRALARYDELRAVAVLTQHRVLHLVNDGHAPVDAHQVGIDVGTEEIGLSEQFVLLLLRERRSTDTLYHVVTVTYVSPGRVGVVGHVEIVEVGNTGVVSDFLFGVHEDGEATVLLSTLRPAVSIAHRSPVVGGIGAVAVTAAGGGQQPVVEARNALVGSVVVAIDGGVVEVSVVFLLFEEGVATANSQ